MMNISKFNALVNFGGGYYSAERRQALGITLPPRSPKGGQRRRGISSRLIDSIGGDSYGK